MKVTGYVTNRKTGECRKLSDIPKEEWQELGIKLNVTAIEAAGATLMKGQDSKETV